MCHRALCQRIWPDVLELGVAPAHAWTDLLRLGGFPEPLTEGSEARAKRWSRLRAERLLTEDVRDTATCEMSAISKHCDC